MNNDYRELSDIVAPAHTAVLVVDMQRDFCDPDGLLGKRGVDMSGVTAMLPAFGDFLVGARRGGVSVIFVRMVQADAYASAALREINARHQTGPLACAEGTSGTEFIPELQPEPGELVVTKHTYSAFVGTDLAGELGRRGVETLVVTGVSSNVCVESTCRDAFFRDFFVVVPQDLVACANEERQRATIYNLDRFFGRVTTSREVAAAWGA